MELLLTKLSKIERAVARLDPTTHRKGTPMTRRDDNDIFDAQHLTAKDIEKLEEALNTMDLEEVVATVDAIVGRHHSKVTKHAMRKR